MSIGSGVVVAVALHQIDDAPDTEASAQSDHEGLENTYRRSKKCHKSYCRDSWTFRPFLVLQKPEQNRIHGSVPALLSIIFSLMCVPTFAVSRCLVSETNLHLPSE